MDNDVQAKVLHLLDVIAIEVAANRNETAGLRSEMQSGFDRVDRRLGNLEIRVEDLETEVRSVNGALRSFRGEFERRIAPREH